MKVAKTIWFDLGTIFGAETIVVVVVVVAVAAAVAAAVVLRANVVVVRLFLPLTSSDGVDV